MLKSVITSLSSSSISTTKLPICLGTFTPVRHGMGVAFGGTRYIDSKDVGPSEQYTEVEKSFEEWKYVEKLLPNLYVPNPPTDHTKIYPSGWKPPNPVPKDAQYYIPRNRNHMVPVHVKTFEKERERRWTLIKRVEGNIWALEKDIGNYLTQKYPGKCITTWVNESWRIVFIRQDYSADVKEWIMKKGF